MFENRKYVIIGKDDVSSVDFSQVLETSADTLRYSLDGSKTFVKYEGIKPSFLASLWGPSNKRVYTHSEIIRELAKDEWYLDQSPVDTE